VVGLLKRFPDLTELGLYKTEASTIMLLLQQLGQRLSRLTLLDAHQKLKFSEVLRLCPNLQMFHVHFCYFEESSDFWPQFDCAKSLQELSLHMFYKVLSPGFIFKVRHSIKFQVIFYSHLFLV
jgi:hypothetical protein